MDKIDMMSGRVLGGAAFGAPVAEDPIPVRLAEPLVVATGHNDLTVWWWEGDGSVALRIGSPNMAQADTIHLEHDFLTAIWTSLQAIDEGRVVKVNGHAVILKDVRS
jgi:hypothetical protein